MNSDFSPELQAEFLDDFYAECDEHLANMREQLTALDRRVASSSYDPVPIESLYRSLHSFKGISAMAALRPAEELAHSAEAFVRRLSRREHPLDQDGLQVLIHTTQRLEQVVSAHRLRQALPDTSAALSQLAALNANPDSAASGQTATLSSPSASSVFPPTPAPAISSPKSGQPVWRCLFRPSKELDQRGVNLNVVRSRLTELGEIVQATPIIGAGGSMSFEFLVALRKPIENSSAWESDGVQFEPTEPVPSPATAIAPAVEDPESAPPSTHLFVAPSHIVRVDLSRLDDLMRIAGELVIHRSRLDERLHRTVGSPANDRSGLHEVNLSLARSMRDLRQAISRVRLVPVGEIFTRMPFVVRELIQETGKQAQLVVEGQQTEIDKYLVERLKEPLLHLVRNAFAHGVEATEQRLASGKPAVATILLRATAVGQSVIIQVRDDGAGIDAAAVARRAASVGLTVPATLEPAELLEVLCTPGFSTRDQADHSAGRGVGMAVVQTTVRELGGTLTLETEKGQWTRFTLRLPLTLSIIEAFIVGAGAQICAVPQSLTLEIIQISTTQIRTVNQVEVASYRDGVLPLVRLSTLFGSASSTTENLTVIVLDSDRGQVGLMVDRVAGLREVVVRPVRDPLIRVPGISGATELGDGRPVLILDAGIVGNSAVRPRAVASSQTHPAPLCSLASS